MLLLSPSWKSWSVDFLVCKIHMRKKNFDIIILFRKLLLLGYKITVYPACWKDQEKMAPLALGLLMNSLDVDLKFILQYPDHFLNFFDKNKQIINKK